MELRSLGIPARPLATDLHLSKQPVTCRFIDKSLQNDDRRLDWLPGVGCWTVGQRASFPQGRRGCAGDYRRRCATGHLRVCVSRLPTGMTVESPGPGWCHTMRNVPGPGKRRKTASQPHQIDRGLSEKNKTAPSRGVNGADHLHSIDSLHPPPLRVCQYVRVPVWRTGPRCRSTPNAGGAVHNTDTPPAWCMPSSCAFHVGGPGTSLEKRAFRTARL